MSKENNISPFSAGDGERGKLSEDKLMAYLEGKLSATEQHEVELWLADEGMESDAVEGLRTLKTDDTIYTVNKLKHDLHKKITGKKRRRRQLKTDHFTWIAIAIILLLTVVAYIVIQIAK